MMAHALIVLPTFDSQNFSLVKIYLRLALLSVWCVTNFVAYESTSYIVTLVWSFMVIPGDVSM